MRNKTKKVCIICNGCGRRKLDAERLKNFFKINNFYITKKLNGVDLIVFIACAFTDQRERESLKIIRKLNNFKGQLIIAGCLPKIIQDKLSEIFKEKIITIKNLEEIDDIFREFKYPLKEIPDAHNIYHDLTSSFLIFSSKNPAEKIGINSIRLIKNSIFETVRPKINKEKQPYYLRISYGCLGNCTYCVIKKAIGPLKSKQLDVCIEEYKDALARGYKDFIFLADDLGAYGLDIKSSLPELLNNLMSIDLQNSNINWSLKEMHSRWLIKYKSELVNILKYKRIKYILCGIQSGNNRILNLMNRHHKREEIIETIKKFRKTNPALKLSAQVIVGFPSEKNEDLDRKSVV